MAVYCNEPQKFPVQLLGFTSIVGCALLELHPEGDAIGVAAERCIERVAIAVHVGSTHVEIGMVGRVCCAHASGVHASCGHGTVGYDAEEGCGVDARAGLARVGVGRLLDMVTGQGRQAARGALEGMPGVRFHVVPC